LDDARCRWGNRREVWAASSYVEDLSLEGAFIHWLTFLAAGRKVPYSHWPELSAITKPLGWREFEVLYRKKTRFYFLWIDPVYWTEGGKSAILWERKKKKERKKNKKKLSDWGIAHSRRHADLRLDLIR
jgi:hypothetical protein